MDGALLFAYAETPLHHGGPESSGVVDLPIQRESTTGIPTIWGQSAKGALRQHARDDKPRWAASTLTEVAVFGSEAPGADDDASAQLSPGWLAVGDFRLVALPVPTLDHTFAWATSPLLLARLARVAGLAGIRGLPRVPSVADGQVLATGDRWVRAVHAPGIAIADYDFAAAHQPAGAAWGDWLADNGLPRADPTGANDAFTFFRNKLRTDLLIVSDDDLKALTRECAEVVARIQLDPGTKTVNNLWYTEYLPAETILMSYIRSCSPAGDMPSLRSLLDGELLVAGGDETVGKGLMWLRWLS